MKKNKIKSFFISSKYGMNVFLTHLLLIIPIVGGLFGSWRLKYTIRLNETMRQMRLSNKEMEDYSKKLLKSANENEIISQKHNRRKDEMGI